MPSEDDVSTRLQKLNPSHLNSAAKGSLGHGVAGSSNDTIIKDAMSLTVDGVILPLHEAKKLKRGFGAEVVDESDGCGAKFNIVIVSDEFEGKRVLQTHKLVQEAISDIMPSIHAVTIKTYTKAKWEVEKSQ